MLIALPNSSSQTNSERLLAEHAKANDAALQARLLLEIGMIEEGLGNNEAAARHFEAALAANSLFREPLERLLALQQRQPEPAGLGKLLESLLQAAGSAEEQQRALLARAVHLAEHEHDLLGARSLLEQWLAEHPRDIVAWLTLEIIAAQLSDAPLRIRALGERAACSENPAWRALLLLDLGRLQFADNDLVGAKQSFEQVLQSRTCATWRALTALERISRGSDEATFVAALDARARLLAAALRGEVTAGELSVPKNQCSPHGYGGATLLAAQALFQQGDAERAARLLDSAIEMLPDEALLLSVRLQIADTALDHQKILSIAGRLLETDPSPTVAATLWLRIAEAQKNLGDHEQAIHALRQATAANAECWIARARLLDALLTKGTPDQLAEAVEDGAQRVSTPEAKAFAHLAAAEILVSASRQLQAGNDSLTRAVAAGAPRELVARISRFLALIAQDQPGHECATAALLALDTGDRDERSDWCLQLLRARLARRDAAGTADAIKLLEQNLDDPALLCTLHAYLDPSWHDATSNGDGNPLLRLTQSQHESGWKQALYVAAARRAQREQSLEEAIAILRRANSEHPHDSLIAIYLAELINKQGNVQASVNALSQSAATLPTSQERQALRLQAGLMAWRSGLPHTAYQEIERALTEGADFPASTASWCCSALAHGTGADDAGAGGEGKRREAWGIVADADPTDAFCRLQQWVWSSCTSDDVRSTQQALDAFEKTDAGSNSALRATADLARALWAGPAESAGLRLQAMGRLEQRCGTRGALTAAARYLEATHDQAPLDARLEAAEHWAKTESTLAAACEWLALAHATHNRGAEAHALLHLAALLPSDEGEVIADSGRMLSWLDGSDLKLGPARKQGAPIHSETAPPGAHAKERAIALEAVLGMYPSDAHCTNTLLGFNYLEAEQPAEAELCFRAATQADPYDVAAWDGLREVALKTQDAELLAEALAALGDTTLDPFAAFDLWYQASTILLDTLQDEERGKLALARAVEIDPSRTEAYERLVELVHQRRDSGWLARLIDARLSVIDSAPARVTLYWDKARALRRLGDLEGTLLALEQLIALEPDNVNALTLSGEVHLTRGDYLLACEKLAALAAHNDAPEKQRVLSGLAAADVARTQLQDPARALLILQGLCDAGIASLPVRERMVQLAAQIGDWETAVAQLQELKLTRTDREGRIAAARLAIAIHRDRLDDASRAGPAVETLLQEIPSDPEGLDFVLSLALAADTTERLLHSGRTALLTQLRTEPVALEAVLRLAAISDALNDPLAKQSAFGAARALGHLHPDIDRVLAELAARCSTTPNACLNDVQLGLLCDPLDHGPLSELCQLLSTSFIATFGPNLETLGVAKHDHVPAHTVMSRVPELLAWTEALGLESPQLFAGGDSSNPIVGTVCAEAPALVLHPSLFRTTDRGARMDAAKLQSIARQALGLKRGTLILHHHAPAQVAGILSGLCALSGTPIAPATPVVPQAVVAKLHDDLRRKERKAVAALASEIARRGEDPFSWALAAQRSLDRIAALAVGDVSWAQAAIPGATRSALPQDGVDRDRALRLIRFAFSEEYSQLRADLGMGPR